MNVAWAMGPLDSAVWTTGAGWEKGDSCDLIEVAVDLAETGRLTVVVPGTAGDEYDRIAGLDEIDRLIATAHRCPNVERAFGAAVRRLAGTVEEE